MSPPAPESIRQCRAARRLTRLFRIERLGGFERWRADVVQRLLDRRAAIIGELLALAPTPPDPSRRSPELYGVLHDLSVEVARSQTKAQERADVLAGELRARRGADLTGLRSSATGHLLGRG